MAQETCAQCGAPLGADQAFCSNCGAAKPVQPTCPQCGAPVQQGQEFCSACGQRLIQPQAQPVVEPQPVYQQPVYQQPAYQQAPVYQQPMYQQPVPPAPPKKNVCAILAIIFGAIGMIPLLNFLFLPVAIVLGIIGIFKSKGRKKGTMIASVIVVTISLLISIAWIGGSIDTENYQDKYGAKYGDKFWCQIASDGSYMKIDTNPYNTDDYHVNDAVKALEYVCNDLGMPAAYQKMLKTKYIDGVQSYTFGQFSVTWTYHPDKGLEATFRVD